VTVEKPGRIPPTALCFSFKQINHCDTYCKVFTDATKNSRYPHDSKGRQKSKLALFNDLDIVFHNDFV
jgi:hypothetical protein